MVGFYDKNIGKLTCHESKRSSVVNFLLMDYDIWNILINYEVHYISDLSDHCLIEISINAPIREKGEIMLDHNDMGKDEFKLIKSDHTDEILHLFSMD